MIADGQAVPVKTVQTVEKLLYNSDESSSILDPHFVTVKQYTYDYTDTDVLLKVVSKISYEGSTEPVKKVEYIDLTDKTLGQYQIALDLRKDVSADTPTESQKFAVYVSKMKAYTASRLQTVEIPVISGANTFILTQEGTGLTNITWAYSADGGSSWTEFTAGEDTSLDGATSIILRAKLTPGDETPTLTSFNVTFLTVESNSEDYVFTGKEKDVTGLVYFGARYYDPEVGEFISEDPGQDGTDWYRYCNGNPVNYVDPDGRVALVDDAAIVAAYAYFTTLLASPDFSTDMYVLQQDATSGDVFGTIIDGLCTLVPGLPAGGGRTISEVLGKYGSKVGKYLIGEYGKLNRVWKGLRGGSIEVHHLIEKRFATLLGVDNPDEILSIVLPKGVHNKITQRFRTEIGHLRDRMAKINTNTATLQDLWNAVESVYPNNSPLKELLWNTYFKGKPNVIRKGF